MLPQARNDQVTVIEFDRLTERELNAIWIPTRFHDEVVLGVAPGTVVGEIDA